MLFCKFNFFTNSFVLFIFRYTFQTFLNRVKNMKPFEKHQTRKVYIVGFNCYENCIKQYPNF